MALRYIVTLGDEVLRKNADLWVRSQSVYRHLWMI